ncbi:PREDICTED: uncharacterized protein LOC105950333 [Erythranthe guttata]|uniref:uncharacterized protein LOC105950333 n=1 Tax=Erythranthe guttata TaxID=4155 RepID=UPI00064DF951|nr:PREDICTED: uncharacterized protein LOC105950333 [Erythranthe guttata]|eukprot:XP_012829138.1 PREDICTED: uncharacterized protein LOC105950333 [Erythranthe guttata]
MNSTGLIWEEPWIPYVVSFKPSPIIADSPPYPSYRLVRNLFLDGSNLWNVRLLYEMFPHSVVQEIRKIHFSHIPQPKKLFSCPSKSGNFTSRSAYLTDIASRCSHAAQNSTFSWNYIWNAKIHNRHKLLLWRIIIDLLPTKAKLNSFFPLNDLLCPICGLENESANHLFIRCPFLLQIWFTSKWNLCLNPFINEPIKDCIALVLKENGNLLPSEILREEFVVYVAIICDIMWKNRNLITHGSSPPSLQDSLRILSSSASTHWNSELAKSTTSGKIVVHSWTKPPKNWLKVNSDCSFSNGQASCVFIIRNCNGSILLAHSSIHLCHDPLTVESIAVREACNFIANAKLKNVMFELDLLNAILFIKDHSSAIHWTASHLIHETQKFWGLRSKLKFRFCSRNANYAAHNLAKWSFSSVFCGFIPVNCLPLPCFGDRGSPIGDKFNSYC